MQLGQAQFWIDLSGDCRLRGQSLGKLFLSLTTVLRFSGVSLWVVLAMGHFIIGGISSIYFIFTKYLLFQPQLGLASKFNSYEDKGQVSCMGTIS